jgi:hypothetical protein
MHGPLPVGTSELLIELGNPDGGELLLFDELLLRFGSRAFGVLLLIALLPAFIPAPIGMGAISGPLICLLGLQLMLLRPAPWLPGFVRRRGLRRSSIRRFLERTQRLLARLERVCRPRLPALIEHPLANAFTGLQLVLLGFLLALPIPLTNYPFGILLLFYVMALIERDGKLLLVAWILGLIAIIGTFMLSTEVIELLQRLLG